MVPEGVVDRIGNTRVEESLGQTPATGGRNVFRQSFWVIAGVRVAESFFCSELNVDLSPSRENFAEPVLENEMTRNAAIYETKIESTLREQAESLLA